MSSKTPEGGLARHGLVVGRTGGRHRQNRQDRDRRLLHALRRQARGLRQEIRLRAGGQLRGNPGGWFDRGHHQHHAESRAPGIHERRRRKPASTFFSTNPSPTRSRTEKRSPKRLRGGGRGARHRLPEAAGGPLPLDQEEDRRGRVRQARAGGVQHQQGQGRPVRTRPLALSVGTPCRAASCSRSASTTPTC